MMEETGKPDGKPPILDGRPLQSRMPIKTDNFPMKNCDNVGDHVEHNKAQ